MLKYLSHLLLMLIILGCDSLTPQNEATVVKEDNKIFIVDRTNKKWDVTHAVENYNFNADAFQYGLGPNAIRPINDPEFWNPGESGYPANSQTTQVIGANLYNQIRAYPLNVLSRHEIVNDTFAGKPLAVGYWPLVGLTAVYSRVIDNDTLTISASGWTYDYTFVLYDYETESLWYHLSGTDGLTCISGTYADKKLEEFNSTQTRWNTWATDNPNSQYLKYP